MSALDMTNWLPCAANMRTLPKHSANFLEMKERCGVCVVEQALEFVSLKLAKVARKLDGLSKIPAVGASGTLSARPAQPGVLFSSPCKKALALLFLLLSAWPATLRADAGPGFTTFKKFLENPPKIRFARWAMSGNSYVVDGKPLVGRIHYEGAWQGATFYVRALTKGEGQLDTFPDAGSMGGRSSKGMYWYSDDGADPVIELEHNAKGFNPTSGPPNRARYLSEGLEDQINEVRGLLTSWLEPGELRWVGPRHFSAQSNSHGVIQGDIVALTNGCVARIEFTVEDHPGLLRAVDYGYEFGKGFTGLPNSSTFWYRTTNDWQLLSAMYLEELQLGEDPALPADGYLPGNIQRRGATLASNAPAPALILHSNGVAYSVRGKRLEAVAPYDLQQFQKLLRGKSHGQWWAILIIINAFLFLWLFTRKSQRPS